MHSKCNNFYYMFFNSSLKICDVDLKYIPALVHDDIWIHLCTMLNIYKIPLIRKKINLYDDLLNININIERLRSWKNDSYIIQFKINSCNCI